LADKIKNNIKDIVQDLIKGYTDYPVSSPKIMCKAASRSAVKEITGSILDLIFPGYSGGYFHNQETLPYYVGDIILTIEQKFTNQIYFALSQQNCGMSCEHGCCRDDEELQRRAEEICFSFFKRLPKLREYASYDVQAALDGDPAAMDKDQIISCYPGVFAVTVYRIANELLKLDVPYIPRIMCEFAHNKTGIEIHPGAQIGKYFFIDHGTGVVIGETSVIGDNVKIYQGVTLGALSTRGGQTLKGKKRHPTIEDGVTIYSGASVLGGETVIGKGVTIGGNAFITESVYKS
jgi:serine O-acetyltransferase